MKLERSTPVLVVFAVLAALAVWAQNTIVPFSQPFWGLFDYQFDLDVYRCGAQTVLDGGDLYRTKCLGQMDFTYAPISIVFFIPFALLPTGIAHVLWTVLIFAALFGVILLGFRSLGHTITWRLVGVSASLTIISTLLEPVRTTIWFGQINVFLMLLILADLLRGEKSFLRGAGTGLAAGIKLTPLLFAVYLALTRQWRAAITLVGAFAATIAIGFAIMPSASKNYWTETLFDSNRVASPQTVGNQSIRGFIANMMHTDHPSTLLWVICAGLVGLLGLAAAVAAHRLGQELLALSLIGMTSCAVSPVAWGHHWVWLVPLLVVAVHLLFALPWPLGRDLIAAGTVAGFLGSLAWRAFIGHPIWYVNQSVGDAWLTGIFFHNDGWYRWFTLQAYTWILVIVSIVVLIVYARSDRRSAPAADAVGTRR
ncbi:MAG: glycosyltransferase 87 family protein [Gordonia sp. (in: high G+C Gram-positive bacteria)]|uniref:glycosyltransferase 87 family protein n=1 Tax=Gordonia sp. (in: high G+C Gram-positive bacteria) TaxID=84139 RepID=UPI0039E450BF